jgi:hypothetical protein
VFDSAINSIQVSLAFLFPTYELHISLRVGERLRSFGLGEDLNTIERLSVPFKELGKFSFKNLENLQEVSAKPKQGRKFLSMLC